MNDQADQLRGAIAEAIARRDLMRLTEAEDHLDDADAILALPEMVAALQVVQAARDCRRLAKGLVYDNMGQVHATTALFKAVVAYDAAVNHG